MRRLLNDLSVHGQFQSHQDFFSAVTRLMQMRSIALQFDREIYCYKGFLQSRATTTTLVSQTLDQLEKNRRLAILGWLSKAHKYWNESLAHSDNDYFDCVGQCVTGTAIGEAAHHCIKGVDVRLTSISPSSWTRSLLSVDLVHDDKSTTSTKVENFIDALRLEAALRATPSAVATWEQLGKLCTTRFTSLIFAEDCISPLRGYPFVNGAAEQILALLDTLNQFKQCFDAEGDRTERGQEIYQDYFTGDKAWFTDSSQTEKSEFKKELTFSNPERSLEKIFCTWHGKVKTPQYRIHFSWPISAVAPLYVVYIGPKITKR